MAAYAVSILVLGRPVMCDTIEAPDIWSARAAWEAKFRRDPDEFRAEIPNMDDSNRQPAERMLKHMEETRERARQFGIEVTARKSRAKAA